MSSGIPSWASRRGRRETDDQLLNSAFGKIAVWLSNVTGHSFTGKDVANHWRAVSAGTTDPNPVISKHLDDMTYNDLESVVGLHRSEIEALGRHDM